MQRMLPGQNLADGEGNVLKNDFRKLCVQTLAQWIECMIAMQAGDSAAAPVDNEDDDALLESSAV